MSKNLPHTVKKEESHAAEIERPNPPLPKLEASPIPQVAEKVEVATVANGGAPADDDYTDGLFVMRDGPWSGEQFALCKHEPDSYGCTHSAKNSLHFWQGTAEAFRKAFEKA